MSAALPSDGDRETDTDDTLAPSISLSQQIELTFLAHCASFDTNLLPVILGYATSDSQPLYAVYHNVDTRSVTLSLPHYTQSSLLTEVFGGVQHRAVRYAIDNFPCTRFANNFLHEYSRQQHIIQLFTADHQPCLEQFIANDDRYDSYQYISKTIHRRWSVLDDSLMRFYERVASNNHKRHHREKRIYERLNHHLTDKQAKVHYIQSIGDQLQWRANDSDLPSVVGRLIESEAAVRFVTGESLETLAFVIEGIPIICEAEQHADDGGDMDTETDTVDEDDRDAADSHDSARDSDGDNNVLVLLLTLNGELEFLSFASVSSMTAWLASHQSEVASVEDAENAESHRPYFVIEAFKRAQRVGPAAE